MELGGIQGAVMSLNKQVCKVAAVNKEIILYAKT
jgi:hypothetical protein